MSAPYQDPEPPTETFEWVGPGTRLRDAREAAGLGLDEVAGRLHLDASTIQALEANDYEQLPAPTFVRGYLRGYARLLGLPAEPLVEDFDRQGLGPPALVADISESPQARTTDFPVRIATWVIVAGLAVLVIMWWNSQKSPAPVTAATVPESGPEGPAFAVTPLPADAPLPADDATITPMPAPLPPLTDTLVQPIGDSDSPVALVAMPAPATDLAPIPSALGETSLAAMTPAPAQRPSVAPAPPAPTAAADASAELGETIPVMAPAPPAPEPAAPAANDQPGGGLERVELRFRDESWVEVYDRDESRLFFNLVRGGGEVDVTGPGPLRVVVGNARGVQVDHNGQSFDYAPYVSKGIARFRLGTGAGADSAAFE